MEKKIRIGSRASVLAVVQSRMVLDYIRKHSPETEAELVTMTTTGDKILDRTLDKVGGKGLFVRELDRALMEGRSDLSVHSLKDVPMEVPPELPLIAFSPREDARDALVLPEGVTEWDRSLPVGCSSLRRKLQLERLFPGITVKPVRGNLQTRLKKLEEEGFGALVLAAAGLKRMGLEARIARYFSPQEIIPAAGQGILAVQGRLGGDYGCLDGYDDADAHSCALAERAFVRELDGGCSSPVAAYAEVKADGLHLRGLYYEESERRICRGERIGSVDSPEKLGQQLADELKKRAKGRVFLVGAGPGDPGLLTLKGKRAIEEADVVVYDALVGDGILAMIPASAEAINVGKRASRHLMSQEEISRTLVRKAQEGKRVVRLKGGDPFLFGRGGEELELLRENDVACEVVPGVTSALAVPAYNGIPVTHRDFCSSVHIITGHRRSGAADGEDGDIAYDALVQAGGTLVFLMGVSALPRICRGLLAAGMAGDMPAAVLQKGTLAGQKRIIATLSTLEEAARRQGVETPAIIVVGQVCALADNFAWAESLPLFGKKILVTRPRELSSVMADKLRRKGAEVLEMPAIRTEEIRPNPALEAAIADGNSYDWLVFTSPTGVKVFASAMARERRDMRAFSRARIAAIGSGTVRALEKQGMFADLVPEKYDGESLGKALAAVLKGGERILIPRAAQGNAELVNRLRERPDVGVDDIATYDTRYEKPLLIDETALFAAGEIDYAVFTSASTVRGFAAACPDLAFDRVYAVCIGQQTEAAARGLGIKTAVARQASMDAVVEKLEELARDFARG